LKIPLMVGSIKQLDATPTIALHLPLARMQAIIWIKSRMGYSRTHNYPTLTQVIVKRVRP
jgi:hypothetical protein